MKFNPLTLLALCGAVFGFTSLWAEDAVGARTWTDSKGRKLEAMFVNLEGDVITLQKTDGTEVRLPLASLSAANRAIAKTLKPMQGAFVSEHTPAAIAANQIDSLVGRRLIEENARLTKEKKPAIVVNPMATDEQFVRRVYLDIAGRIPNYEETKAFLTDNSAKKRATLIDMLLDSDGYESHLYNYFADMLRITDRVDNRLLKGLPYIKWLKESLATNKSYDKMVTELMTADGKLWNNGAAGYLLRDAGMPLDNLANTLTCFLGTDVACGQCHDHPFADWTQMQFYQMASFFGATSTKLGGRDYEKGQDPTKALMAGMTKLMEKQGMDSKRMTRTIGDVLKANEVVVHDVGSNRTQLPHDYKYKDGKPFDPVSPKFITWTKTDEKLPAYQQDLKTSENLRESFAKWMTAPSNPRFAMTIANRMWARAMGVGLTQSVGSIDNIETSYNPSLLRHLASEMIRLKFNLKEFQRLIYHSKTYQREATTYEVPMGEAYFFQGPMLRRMSAEQAWDSYMTLVLGEQVDKIKNTQADPYGRALDLDLPKTTVETLAQKIAAIQNLDKLAKAKLGGGLGDAGPKDMKKGKAKKDDDEDEEMMDDTKILQYGSMKLMRAAELEQPSPAGHFLRDFGQSDRTVTDGSAREGSVPQVLVMMNGQAQKMMTDPESLMFRTMKKVKSPSEKMEAIYMSILNRRPTVREKSVIMKDQSAHGEKSYSNVIWALINSREFTFIQ